MQLLVWPRTDLLSEDLQKIRRIDASTLLTNPPRLFYTKGAMGIPGALSFWPPTQAANPARAHSREADWINVPDSLTGTGGPPHDTEVNKARQGLQSPQERPWVGGRM